MRKLRIQCRSLWLAGLAVLFFFPVSVLAQDESDTGEQQTETELVNLKIAEIEASTTLGEETVNVLIDLYRRALTNFERARVEQEAADSFAETIKTAPEELENVRGLINKLRDSDPEKGLNITDGAELGQRLSDEKAKFIQAQEQLSTLRARYTNLVSRPNAARQRLGDARMEREVAVTEMNAPAPIGESSELTEARQWRLRSRAERLAAEIHKLEQEILTHESRLALLEAKEEYAGLEVEQATVRTKILEDTISGRRGAEAQQALQDAVTANQELVSQYEAVGILAAENVELGDRLTQRSLKIQEASENRDSVVALVSRLGEELNLTRNRLAIAGLNQAMGQLLIDQQRALPNLSALRKKTAERNKMVANVGLEQIEYGEQRRELRDIDLYIDALVEGLPAGAAGSAREELRPLVESRQELVGKSIEASARYLRILGELDMAQRQLTDAVRDYKNFLDSTLLWVRNTSPIRPDVFLSMPSDIKRLVSPDNWGGFFRDFKAGLSENPLYAVLLAVFLLLSLLRRHFLARIENHAECIGRITKDRFSYTFRALLNTVLAAGAIPLTAVLLASVVISGPSPGLFSSAVAKLLPSLAVNIFIILFFVDACRVKGLLRLHCGWTDATVDKLQGELRWFLVVFPMLRLIGDVSYNLDSGEVLGGLAVFGSVSSGVALGVLLFRLFHPAGGVLREYLLGRPRSLLAQTRSFWAAVLTSILPLLIILWLFGYNYTADVLASSFVYSFWLLLWLMVLQSLLVRWLVLGYQQVELKAAIKRRDAARAARLAAKENAGDTSDDSEVELVEPRVDFEQLSSNSHLLIRTLMILVALFWLYLIWAPIIPALGVLEDISLWTHSGIVNGATAQIPVTLADVLLAIIITITTWAAVKGVPALLELLLLKTTSMTMGGRYTATTLLRYAIVGIGSVVVISILGLSWSKAQWLVAALGVGIGFGLQEIVANFISGLVLLFERPIRVGDTVTVGETSGTVSRIQIRATTIRDWDNRELLVPNKEFITGRLLNWTLSDELVRLVIPVGVAYGSDVTLAMKLAEEAAREHERVLAEPEPSILFSEFGDSTLNLSLRVYLPSMEHRLVTRSELNQLINRKFKEAGIQIAFPQRDVHLDTTRPLEIRMKPSED